MTCDLANPIGAITPTSGLSDSSISHTALAFSFEADAALEVCGTAFALGPTTPTGGPIRIGLSSLFGAGSGITIATIPWLTTTNAVDAYADIDVGDLVTDGWNVGEFDGLVQMAASDTACWVIVNTSLDNLYCTIGSTVAYTPDISFAGSRSATGASGGAFDEDFVDNISFDPMVRILGELVVGGWQVGSVAF